MKYSLSGETFDFVFNGHGLEVDEEYMLIYYPDPWPGTGLICLGEGTANGGGEVHIAGSVESRWGQASQVHKIESFDSGQFNE